jgi:hypothetical protein
MTTRRSCEASAGRCRGRSGSQTALAAHLRADPARRDVRGIEDEVLEVFAALLLELNAQTLQLEEDLVSTIRVSFEELNEVAAQVKQRASARMADFLTERALP